MSSVYNGDSGRANEASASNPDRRTIEASASKPDNRYGPAVLGAFSLVAAVVGAVFFKLNLNYFSHHKDLYALGVWGITSVGMAGLSNLYLFSERNKGKGSNGSSGASDPLPSDSTPEQPAPSKVPKLSVPRTPSSQGSRTTPQGPHPETLAKAARAAKPSARAPKVDPVDPSILGIVDIGNNMFQISFTMNNQAYTHDFHKDHTLSDIKGHFSSTLQNPLKFFEIIQGEKTELEKTDLWNVSVSKLFTNHNGENSQIGIALDTW